MITFDETRAIMRASCSSGRDDGRFSLAEYRIASGGLTTVRPLDQLAKQRYNGWCAVEKAQSSPPMFRPTAELLAELLGDDAPQSGASPEDVFENIED